MTPSVKAAVFAAVEAIRSGDWDDYLDGLVVSIRNREKVLATRDHMPLTTPAMQSVGQVWVWINHSGWEIRGTGVTGL
jgi:hypothetical protein